jgi:competence protein ComEC
MVKWAPFTFVRIALFLIAGIVVGIYLKECIPISIAVSLLVFLVATYPIAFVARRYFNLELNFGVIALPAVFLAGYIHLHLSTDLSKENHYLTAPEEIVYYEVLINRYTEQKERSWKVEGKVLRVNTGRWENKQGKIILYFSKADFQTPFRYGDVLLVKGSPDMVNEPNNPGEFNYKRYLGFRNIYHQHFLRKDDVLYLRNAPKSTIMNYALAARVWAEKTLNRYVDGEREQAIASALILGVTDGLDNELLNAYAATGAMHVLAVSGLHISIIYMLLMWIFKPMLKLQGGEWFLAIASLLVLWGYAFVTGLSPSVLRAVTMFSFMAIARPMGKSTNIYNTLAASAFCILLFDPFLIMSVGFQLSYLAVIGIVYFQPGLYDLWAPKMRLMDEVWKITCVSIAAQIATFGLGLLYFHQFPNYFMISNLFVIPIAFVVLIAGIVVLAVSFFSALASVLGWILMWSIKVMNWLVFVVESFPFSLIEDIYITTYQCWLLGIMIVAFSLLFRERRFNHFLIAFGIAILVSWTQWFHFKEEVTIEKLIIYNVKGHFAMDLISKGQTFFVTDSLLLKDENKIRFHIRPNRLISGVNKVLDNTIPIRKVTGGRILQWKELHILNIEHKDFSIPEGLLFDLIIISNNSVRDLTVLKTHFSNKLILDSTNSYFYSKRLKDDAMRLTIPFHAVVVDGAFDLRVPAPPRIFTL